MRDAGENFQLTNGGCAAIVAGRDLALRNGCAGFVLTGRDVSFANGEGTVSVAGQRATTTNHQGTFIAAREVEMHASNASVIVGLIFYLPVRLLQRVRGE